MAAMNDPKPLPPGAEPELGQGPGRSDKVPPDDTVRVRETLGAGLRKFYDSVLDEPIPDDWLNIVGEGSDEEGAA
jgi:hypothetical protein